MGRWTNIHHLGSSTWLPLALMVTGCTNGPDVVIPPAQQAVTVHLQMAVEFNHGGHSYELASTYTDTAGHVFKLDTIRFLVSELHAMDDYHNVVGSFPEAILVADAANASNALALGEITTAHLHELIMYIGLGPDVNHLSPGEVSTDPAVHAMHSGSTTSGFCFLHLAGRVDSNGDAVIDATDQAFTFKCIGDELLRGGAANLHTDLIEGQELVAWLPVDLEILLAGIDLLATPSSIGNAPINVQLMDQFSEAIEQEH